MESIHRILLSSVRGHKYDVVNFIIRAMAYGQRMKLKVGADLFEVSPGLELAIDEVVEEHQGRLPELNLRDQGQLQERSNHP